MVMPNSEYASLMEFWLKFCLGRMADVSCFLLIISKLVICSQLQGCDVEHLCNSNALGCHTVLHLMEGNPRAVSLLGIPWQF